MRFLVDLDGVLVDFVAGAAALFGKQELINQDQQPGQDLNALLGLRPGQLWRRIDEAGAAFWRDLPPTSFADELMGFLLERGEVVICTAPSQDPMAAAGKLMWMQRRFGKRFRDYIISPRKELLAAADQVLLDDSQSHIDKTLVRGGRAILVPTYANAAPGYDDPLAVLLPAIQQICDEC